MVAMSGGIDSSVAALVLERSGYEVSGVTMVFKAAADGFCAKNIKDAASACRMLGIKHYVYDISGQMQEYVVEPFIRDYLSGKTPNPCIECNRYLKFGVLFDMAMAAGFDFFATGHYASVKEDDGQYYLARSPDKKKDQSYFLYAIKKENLSKVLFPISCYTKDDIKKIAKEASLPAAERAESQEICFIPDDDYKSFIRSRAGLNTGPGPGMFSGMDTGLGLDTGIDSYSGSWPDGSSLKGKASRANVPGDIVDMDGKIIGMHKGIGNFTIGQRKGIGISAEKPLYVINIDAVRNEVVVGGRQFLKKKRLLAHKLNLLVKDIPGRVKAKIRYNHQEAGCSMSIFNNVVEVIFDEPQDAITPGQSVVFYDGDIVLGGAIIEKVCD